MLSGFEPVQPYEKPRFKRVFSRLKFNPRRWPLKHDEDVRRTTGNLKQGKKAILKHQISRSLVNHFVKSY